jgi:NitT/TauT family transport system ATP-binding protein
MRMTATGQAAGGATSADVAPLVAYNNVSKVFDAGVHAVSEVSLDVMSGEFVVFVGPSGCGKTTLMRMTAGLAFPTSGEVLLHGQRVTKISPEVGFVTQDNKLYPWMSLLDNVAFPLKAQGMKRRERRERAMELLGWMGLADAAHRYPSQISGGMQRRGSIARTLIYDPAVILMDEPFASLDALTKRLLQQELKRICDERNWTVIFVTHDLYEAIALGHRVVVFSKSPARIKEIVSVPPGLAQHEDGDERSSGAIDELQRQLWTLLRSEIAEAP